MIAEQWRPPTLLGEWVNLLVSETDYPLSKTFDDVNPKTWVWISVPKDNPLAFFHTMG